MTFKLTPAAGMRYYKFDRTKLFSRWQRFYSAAVNARRVSLGCAAFRSARGAGRMLETSGDHETGKDMATQYKTGGTGCDYKKENG